jgi:hypothetical protein
MKYSKAMELLNRRSVKLAIKISDFLRNLKSKILKKNNVEENHSYEYEPNADPVRTWSNVELKKFFEDPEDKKDDIFALPKEQLNTSKDIYQEMQSIIQ